MGMLYSPRADLRDRRPAGSCPPGATRRSSPKVPDGRTAPARRRTLQRPAHLRPSELFHLGWIVRVGEDQVHEDIEERVERAALVRKGNGSHPLGIVLSIAIPVNPEGAEQGPQTPLGMFTRLEMFWACVLKYGGTGNAIARPHGLRAAPRVYRGECHLPAKRAKRTLDE